MSIAVRRDARGVPPLRTGDPDELAFAQGRVTARDRAWQPEVERHRAQGTTAAFLGAAELGRDVFARRVRLSTPLLFAGFPTELWREEVARRLGEEWTEPFATDGPGTAGSDGWVVTGGRTASGTALVAGDPHRFVEAPGVPGPPPGQPTIRPSTTIRRGAARTRTSARGSSP